MCKMYERKKGVKNPFFIDELSRNDMLLSANFRTDQPKYQRMVIALAPE